MRARDGCPAVKKDVAREREREREHEEDVAAPGDGPGCCTSRSRTTDGADVGADSVIKLGEDDDRNRKTHPPPQLYWLKTEEEQEGWVRGTPRWTMTTPSTRGGGEGRLSAVSGAGSVCRELRGKQTFGGGFGGARAVAPKRARTTECTRRSKELDVENAATDVASVDSARTAVWYNPPDTASAREFGIA
ncbi:hypothetical protein B0H12DRAFT_1328990 [Mycena haematopus]|nr:hypothetical protein B0H12DRAFT_1328990 [Mycena haematopus]